MLGVPKPKLGVSKPRLGVPKPRLGVPKLRIGASKPRGLEVSVAARLTVPIGLPGWKLPRRARMKAHGWRPVANHWSDISARIVVEASRAI